MFAAASLAGAMRSLARTEGARVGLRILVESGGSLEHARTVTELGRVPDALLLADEEVVPRLLVPVHADWYARVARGRMTVAYMPRSRHASEIDSVKWTRILRRPDVEVGRPDPARAPAGYRTLLLLRLAARHYGDPELERAILARSPARNVRGNAAELAALLETGEVDYIFEYESLALARGFHVLRLPPEIDLGEPARAAHYATAEVRVPGATRADTVTIRGAPIAYALVVPRRAPHPEGARRLAELLLSAPGRAALAAARVDLLERPELVGDAPAWARALGQAAP